MLGVLALSLGDAVAGPWTREKGDTYAKVVARGLIGSGRGFAADGSIGGGLPSYNDARLDGYVETGLSEGLTGFVFGSPLGYANFNGASTAYVGPLGLGLRKALLSGRTRAAFEASYAYSPRIGNGPLGADFVAPDGRSWVYLPTIENHAADLALSLGRSTPWGWWWTSAGVRLNEAAGVDHALVGAGQFGFPLGKRWAFDLRGDLVLPLGDVEVNNISGVGQTSYLGWTANASFELDAAKSLVFGLGGVVFAKANAGTPALHVGLEF